MNTRYFFFPQEDSSLCDSISLPPLERINNALMNNSQAARLRHRNLSNNNNFLIRLAMKISRSRWYSFFRRVFHYQNGSSSGSSDGPNPFDSINWMVMEFIALLLQISLSLYTLIISKGETPVWPMRLWVSGYAFGCFLSLILLYFRYNRLIVHHHDHLTHQLQDNINIIGSVDIEHQQRINHEESRNFQYMQKCKASIELLFAIWFVMGNVWVLGSRFGSYHRAPKLHVLCVSLLAWNAVCYSFPFILFVLLCCCVPLLSSLLGYNMNTASLQRGATEEQLASLSSWEYSKDASNLVELGNSAKNQQVPTECCCICLGKYRDKEEIRQLPCTHIFHLNCVDQWLKIISCCPLCKQGIE